MATSRRELSFGSVEINLDEVLGVGAYGKVYRAKCGQLPCAAKLLHDTLFQPGTCYLTSKFLQECQFLSTIKHPNIVQYLGTTSDPQSRRPVLLMELMDENLTRLLERLTGPLPYHSQLNLCHDVALALAYLHSNAIIHRDLSSNNVLLIGEGSRAKVTDFGMSKLMDMNPSMTPLTQVPGTPAYMPPEALITPPHYSSKLDCFSHGVLTLQIITRNFPNPSDATTTVEDERYPTRRAFVFIPETERRKKDLDLIEPTLPLLPIALHCLKDMDTERPSADELCRRLASLKREPRYTHSMEQTRELVPRLQQELHTQANDLAEKERITQEEKQLLEETIQRQQVKMEMMEVKLNEIGIREREKEIQPHEVKSTVYQTVDPNELHTTSTAKATVAAFAASEGQGNPRIVELKKSPGHEGFGFQITGGKERKCPICISRIVPGGYAEKQGTLRRGDVLLSVNGESLEGAYHQEAVDLLKGAEGIVRLVLKYSPTILE